MPQIFNNTKINLGVNTDGEVLQETISAYTDEAYTNARKLSGTAIVGGNPQIDTSTESYIGQVRWLKPLNPTINVASLTDPTDGTPTTYGGDYLEYIKTVRTHGAQKVNMAQIITQTDGLAKVGRDFGETQAQDEHNAILSVLKGVAISELLYGAGVASGVAGLGGQTFSNLPEDKKYGFYVDAASALITTASASNQGAQRAESFLKAFGAAYKDYEPEYAYLITSPLVMSSLRSANLVDQNTVSEGNINFSTIFNGKFRILQTRANQGLTTAEIAVINAGSGLNLDVNSVNTSFIVLPGAIAMEHLAVPDAVEITRNGQSYKGGGATNIWRRWGYVLAPAGYGWKGPREEFPSDAMYQGVIDSDGSYNTLLGKDITAGVIQAGGTLAAGATLAGVKGVWERKASSALSLGILPIFHA